MEPQHVPSTLATLPELRVTATTTPAEAAAAMRVLGGFDQCMVGTVCFSGRTPWERHPGDELLHVVQGAVEVTVLSTDAEAHRLPAARDACGGNRRIVVGRSPATMR